MEVFEFINLIVGAGIAGFMILSIVTSLLEREKKAALFSLGGLLLMPLPFFASLIIPEFLPGYYNLSIAVFTFIVVLVLAYNPKQKKYAPATPEIRHDERSTMFSRNELIINSDKYKTYYKLYPENEVKDNEFRKNPGLLAEKSLFFNPYSYAAADACFSTIGKLGPYIKGTPAKPRGDINKDELTKFISGWLKKQGVESYGITLMKDYHYYHTKGRGFQYGSSITPKYKFGIAFTVEMVENMIQTAPKSPTIIESADKYLKSGVIAVQTAEMLRQLGFNAQAHIDGNYEVICPLVAKDAGIGEIGRMGLLMTPNNGPRVRIAVVTTDAPLNIVRRKIDTAFMIEFCEKCKKCATNCPSQAIQHDTRKVVDGALHWKINSEKCFTYWTKIGTDCGRCIQVCPFAHPNNLMHNVIRFGIKYSKLFRQLALILDDVFYGRRPKIHKNPIWIPEYKNDKIRKIDN